MAAMDSKVGDVTTLPEGDAEFSLRIPDSQCQLDCNQTCPNDETVVGNLSALDNGSAASDAPITQSGVRQSEGAQLSSTNSTQNSPELEEQYFFGWLDALTTCISIGVFLGDYLSDLELAVNYVRDGHIVYGALTAALAIFPAVVASVVSVIFHFVNKQSIMLRPPMSTFRRVFKWTCVLCLMSPLPGLLETVYYGFKYRLAAENEKRYYGRHRMCEPKYHSYVKREKLFSEVIFSPVEFYLESAPQLLLQIYIISKTIGVVSLDNALQVVSSHQLFSMVTSFVSLAWGLCSLDRSMRSWIIEDGGRNAYYSDEQQLNRWYDFVVADIVLLLAHIFGTMSRLTALALFASACDAGWFWALIIGHWAVTAVWIRWNTKFHAVLCAFWSLFYIPTFLNNSFERHRHGDRLGKERKRAIPLFYNVKYVTIYCVENLVLSMVWWWRVSSPSDVLRSWYTRPVLMVVIQPIAIALSLGLQERIPHLYPKAAFWSNLKVACQRFRGFVCSQRDIPPTNC